MYLYLPTALIRLNDVVIFEEYNRLIPSDEIELVVDAGAHIGLYSIKHASSVYRIIALEPISDN